MNLAERIARELAKDAEYDGVSEAEKNTDRIIRFRDLRDQIRNEA